MFILVFIIFAGVLWLEYEIRDPQGHWYDMFH